MAELAQIRAYIGIGANIAPERHITAALLSLSNRFTVVGIATFYRTPAIGRPGQPDFLNGVMALDTDLRPRALKDALRSLEAEAGRVRSADRFAARPLDLDILLYGNAIISEDALDIPDPEILDRPFLAAGLLELNPSLTLPGACRSLAEMIDPGVIAGLKKEEAFTLELKERLLHEP